METQQTISQWSSETFGEPGSDIRVATRAGEEMFELLWEITTSANPQKCIEEAADVAIVLYSLCDRLGVNIDTSLIHREDHNGIQLMAAEANAKLASVIVMLCLPDMGQFVRYSLHLVYYFLGKICGKLGGDLQQAVDSKMLINRRRKWLVSSYHDGYHKIHEKE